MITLLINFKKLLIYEAGNILYWIDGNVQFNHVKKRAKKMDIKSPHEFAAENCPKLILDVSLSLGDWNLITQWVKDYADYYHGEMVARSCDICQGTMYYGKDNKLMCQTCHPYFVE